MCQPVLPFTPSVTDRPAYATVFKSLNPVVLPKAPPFLYKDVFWFLVVFIPYAR